MPDHRVAGVARARAVLGAVDHGLAEAGALEHVVARESELLHAANVGEHVGHVHRGARVGATARTRVPFADVDVLEVHAVGEHAAEIQARRGVPIGNARDVLELHAALGKIGVDVKFAGRAVVEEVTLAPAVTLGSAHRIGACEHALEVDHVASVPVLLGGVEKVVLGAQPLEVDQIEAVLEHGLHRNLLASGGADRPAADVINQGGGHGHGLLEHVTEVGDLVHVPVVDGVDLLQARRVVEHVAQVGGAAHIDLGRVEVYEVDVVLKPTGGVVNLEAVVRLNQCMHDKGLGHDFDGPSAVTVIGGVGLPLVGHIFHDHGLQPGDGNQARAAAVRTLGNVTQGDWVVVLVLAIQADGQSVLAVELPPGIGV